MVFVYAKDYTILAFYRSSCLLPIVVAFFFFFFFLPFFCCCFVNFFNISRLHILLVKASLFFFSSLALLIVAD